MYPHPVLYKDVQPVNVAYPQKPSRALQIFSGLPSVADIVKQSRMQERQQHFQQAYGEAWAKGDRDTLKKLAAYYPDQIAEIQKGMGFVDAERSHQLGAASLEIQLAAKSANPSAAQKALQKHAEALNTLEVSPDEAMQLWQQDLQQFSHYADLIGLNALGPEKNFDLQGRCHWFLRGVAR